MPRLHRLCYPIAGMVLLLSSWIGSYAYWRLRNSSSGTTSIGIRQVNLYYDLHYPGMDWVIMIHRPLIAFEEFLLPEFIEIRANNYRGNRDNFGREAFE